MKRILFTANSSYYIYNFRKEVIKNLIDRGYKIYIIAPKDNFTDSIKKMSGLNTSPSFYPLSLKSDSWNIFREFLSLVNIIFLMIMIRPDISFHSTNKLNIYGTIGSIFSRSYNVCNISGMGRFFKKNKKKTIYYLYKMITPFIDKFHFQNVSDKNFFINQFSIDQKKIDKLPGSGVDSKKFKRSKKFSLKGESFRFVFASRLIKEKGILDFIDAAKIFSEKYPHSEFLIYGSEEKNKIFHEEIISRANSITNISVNNFSHIRKILNNCDCVVLPTYYNEGIPKILIEAASMELPIISTKIGGIDEILVDQYNGYFCKINNPNDLFIQMEKIYLSKEKLRKFGKNGRALVIEKFDMKFVLNHYLSVINSLN